MARMTLYEIYEICATEGMSLELLGSGGENYVIRPLENSLLE